MKVAGRSTAKRNWQKRLHYFFPWNRRICSLPLAERRKARALIWGAVGGVTPCQGEDTIKVEYEKIDKESDARCDSVGTTRGRL